MFCSQVISLSSKNYASGLKMFLAKAGKGPQAATGTGIFWRKLF
jgi:hypothetical protein